MGIFRRRSLCFFCFLFAVASLLASGMYFNIKLVCLLVTGFFVIASIVLAIFLKKYRVSMIFVALCLLAVLASVVSTVIRVDLKEMRAKEYVGERTAVMNIISEEYSSDHISVYGVKIRQMGDESTNIKASLVFAFPTELSVGDRVYARAEIGDARDGVLGLSSSRLGGKDVLLTAAIYDPDAVLIDAFDNDLPLYRQLFRRNGLYAVTHTVSSALKGYITRLFGESVGGVVNGFLLGDTSEISTEVIRDFRRTGVSHLLAVSGLHISILLGAVEILLRRLLVPKKARCVIVFVLSLLFLALTGFSASALRCVFMLWVAYVIFMLAEEPDPPTTLFVALVLILIAFPYSVYELGMWMSFLATLGLVTVLPAFQRAIPKIRRENFFVKKLYRAGRGILLVTAMTVISNMFLLPIQWYFFDEVSLVSIPTNVLLSPVTTVYMILSVVTLVVGGVPLVGALCVFLTEKLTGLILLTTSTFASFGAATVSLGYVFSDVLVVLFAVALTALLVIPLRRKWLVGLPLVGFTLVFGVCLAVFNASSPKAVTYYGSGTNETVALSDAQELCIIDMSSGSYGGFAEALSDASAYGATGADTIVFTRVGERHISSMDYFLRSTVVKRIYIPMPDGNDSDELERATELARLALSCGTQAELYSDVDVLTLDAICFRIRLTEGNGKKGIAVLVSTETETFCYADAVALSESDDVRECAAKADTLIIGNKGLPEERLHFSVSDDTTLIFSSQDIMNICDITADKQRVYCNTLDYVKLKFKSG